MGSDLQAFLGTTELFGSLDPEVRIQIEDELECSTLVGGEVLIRQGTHGDCLYILRCGRLLVEREHGDGRITPIAEIGHGEVVGEMALLAEPKRSATVRAIRDCELVRLSKDGFDRLLEQHPKAMMQLARVIGMRLHRMLRGHTVEARARTIAVVAVSGHYPLDDFVQRFARALETHGRTSVLDMELLDRHLRGAEPGKERVTNWLHAQEKEYDYTVFKADPDPSPWTRLCLRQADRILFVAEHGSSPEPNAMEEALQGEAPHTRREWVLIHPEETRRPTGTTPWLQAREMDAHHHVRHGNEEDIARLARKTTGHATGLVLGGGGARGFAHLGVLRALEENGHPIDRIGGTSMGAAMAALYALEGKVDAMQARLGEMVSQLKKVKDYTFPAVSLMAGRMYATILEETFGDAAIEDLWLEFFCVSANLSRAEMVVHRDGPLRTGVRASTSLPGIFPPVPFGDHELLVDGGLLNNLPADIMRQASGSGEVIAVDVGSESDVIAPDNYADSISGWKVLGRRLNPFHKSERTPGIFDILLRTIELSSVHARRRVLDEGIDLYLRPPIESFGMLEFHAWEQIAEVGYHYTQERLAGKEPATPSA